MHRTVQYTRGVQIWISTKISDFKINVVAVIMIIAGYKKGNDLWIQFKIGVMHLVFIYLDF